MRKLFQELKRRNVYRVAVTYATVAFIAFQAVELLIPATTLPPWADELLLAFLIAGFPVAVVVAWAFEMTPEGIRRTQDTGSDGGTGQPTASSAGRAVLVGAVLVVLAAGGGYLLFGGADGEPEGAIDSLAVLPLDNMADSEDQAYFAEGMTEALINHLSQIRSLKVISRTSVMQYRDTEVPLPQIAERLGVDAVVEGSVLHADDRVRITVQLIDGRTDRHLWSDSYDRGLEDVLALQSDVARAVARTIEAELTSSERERLERGGTVDSDAYQAYLKGRFHWNRHTEEHWRTAIDHFDAAIAADSTYAPAWAGLADALNSLAFFGHTNPSEAYARARGAAERALELDPTLTDAHVVLGKILYVYDWDGDGAEEAFGRALELNPNSGEAHHAYALFLTRMARFEEAEQRLARALELDPLSPRMNNNEGWIPLLARDYRTALTRYRSALELHPNFTMTHREVAWAYVEVGRYPEAIRHAEQAVGLSSDDYTLASLGHVLGRAGEGDRARAVLDSLHARQRQRYVSPTNLALVHAGLGEAERALDWLELAAEDRSAFLSNLAVLPLFDPLRHRDRFQALLERMELDDVPVSPGDAGG